MKPDKETVITFWDWEESCRPSLRIATDKHILLEVGGDLLCEISSPTKKDLLSQLEGWRDIFAGAVEELSGSQ